MEGNARFDGAEGAPTCDHSSSMPFRARFLWTNRYACLLVLLVAAALVFREPVQERFREFTYAQRIGISKLIREADRLSSRRTAARLAGSFAYRKFEPLRVTRGSDAGTDELTPQRVFAAIALPTFGSPDPHSFAYLHAAGVSQLVAGDIDSALTTLERAAMAEAQQLAIPAAIARLEDAPLLSDLAAASYAAGQQEDRTELVLRSIDLTARAMAIDPNLHAAAFNRALAIESILTRGQAAKAWSDYLELDANSGWADEARDHIQKLASCVGHAKQEQTTETTATLIEQTLLPAWGDAFLRNDALGARLALDEATSAAEALRTCCSDEFHVRAVEIVRDATRSDSTLASRLARAHQQYGQGRSLYAHNQTSAAIPLFSAARETFRREGDMFALKPWKYLAASRLYLGDAKQALREIDDAITFCAAPACTPAALAHLQWAQAIAAGRAGDPQFALESYAKALAGFERGREFENAASVHALIAENLEFLGIGDEAWPHRRIALRSAEDNGTLDRIFIAFNEAADAAFRRGHLAVARLFQDVVVSAARRETNTLMLANALFWRGRLSHAAGDTSALRDFDEADSLALRVEDRDRRAQLTALIAAARAEAVPPAQAIESLTTAIRYFESAPNHYRLAELYAARAEAEDKESKRVLAEADFSRCIRELETERSGIAGIALRQRYFSQGSEVFDRATRHLWMGNRRAEAFVLAEQSRGRETAGRDHVAFVTLRDLPQSLDDGDAVIEYTLLEDRMLVWVVRPTGTTTVETPATAATVAAAVATMQNAFERDIDVNRALRELSALVYDPIAAHVRNAHRLIVVANKSLRAVPFAALRDGKTDRYIIQDHEIVVAPSATTYVQSLRRDRAMPRSGEPSLVLASYTSADPERHLQTLHAGRNEIRQIGALYHSVALLADQNATPSRVLASASTATVVHIVAHEIENHAHPEFSLVALAPSPDGRDLYANAIAAASFRSTRVVFLSVCGTSGENTYNDPQLTVPESFLAAGVPLVVGALRPVDDAAAAAFAVAFHRAFAATGDPVSALRKAQLDCMTQAPCRNPKDWSPWIAIGGAS